MNLVVLVGRVGKNVTAHTGEKKVTSFSVATHSYYVRDGKTEKHTEWHKVVAYGPMAEFAARNLRKGRLIAVTGYNRASKWEKDGEVQFSRDVVVTHIELLDSGQGA